MKQSELSYELLQGQRKNWGVCFLGPLHLPARKNKKKKKNGGNMPIGSKDRISSPSKAPLSSFNSWLMGSFHGVAVGSLWLISHHITIWHHWSETWWSKKSSSQSFPASISRAAAQLNCCQLASWPAIYVMLIIFLPWASSHWVEDNFSYLVRECQSGG